MSSERLIPMETTNQEGEQDLLPWASMTSVCSSRSGSKQRKSEHIAVHDGKAGVFSRFLPQYSPREQLKGDIVAGVTVGVMTIPQSMAYAVVAGLPPVTGLYASCAPLLCYACLGTSKHLGCGPQALVCILVRSAVHQLGDAGVAGGPVQRAAIMSVLVGMASCLMGFVRMGALKMFLSRSLMTSFVSASAVIIMIELLGDLLGIPVPRFQYPWQTAIYVLCNLKETKLATLSLGVMSMCLLQLCKYCKTRLKLIATTRIPECIRSVLLVICDFSALLVFVIGSVCAYVYSMHGVLISVVGELPNGLPRVAVPEVPKMEALSELTPLVFSMALLVFVIAISAGAPFALKHKYSINADQELVALGCANVVCGLFGGFPISGSMSRSAVYSQCDSSSTLSIAVTAMLVACTLSFLSWIFAFLPHCSLAAIINVSVLGLLGTNEFADAYRVARGDFLVMISTFLVCIGLGMKAGLFVGFIMSIAALTHHAAQPNIVVLGEEVTHEKPVTLERLMTASHGDCRPVPGAVCVRLDAPLSFPNADTLNIFICEELERRRTRNEERIKFVLLDLSGVNYIDATGLQVLAAIRKDLVNDNIQLLLCGLKYPVIQKLANASRTNGAMTMPLEHLYINLRDAVDVVKGDQTPSSAQQGFKNYIKRNIPVFDLLEQ